MRNVKEKRKQHTQVPWNSFVDRQQQKRGLIVIEPHIFSVSHRHDFRKRVASVLQVDIARITILADSPSPVAGVSCQSVGYMISGHFPFAAEPQQRRSRRRRRGPSGRGVHQGEGAGPLSEPSAWLSPEGEGNASTEGSHSPTQRGLYPQTPPTRGPLLERRCLTHTHIHGKYEGRCS